MNKKEIIQKKIAKLLNYKNSVTIIVKDELTCILIDKIDIKNGISFKITNYMFYILIHDRPLLGCDIDEIIIS